MERNAPIHRRFRRGCRSTARLAGLIVLMATGALPGLPKRDGAPQLAIIANPDLPVTVLSAEDLRSIFLATKTELAIRRESPASSGRQSHPVHPVLQGKGPALREFAQRYLGKNATALETYYRSLVFTGRWSMPPAFPTDAAVIEYVAKTSGAIGFVSNAAQAHGVKAIKVMN